MSSSLTLHQVDTYNKPSVQSLQDVLANTYGLYLATHNYHWNVEGPHFYPLHLLFGTQYNEMFEAIDVIAERVRALGAYALPFEGKEILDILQNTSNALNKENCANDRAVRMVHNLIALGQVLITTCQTAKKVAQEMKDDETENLMVERITAHQKMLWMLNAQVK